MTIYQRIGVLLVGLSIVFATFFREWTQYQLGGMFSDYSFFLGDGGRYLVEAFFLLPLFFMILSVDTSKYGKCLVWFFVIRLVLALLSVTVLTSLDNTVVWTLANVFYGIVMDIVLLYLMIRLFNDMSFPFVARAFLLLWALLSLTAFSAPEPWNVVVEQVIHGSFLIGMLLLVQQLYASQTN